MNNYQNGGGSYRRKQKNKKDKNIKLLCLVLFIAALVVTLLAITFSKKSRSDVMANAGVSSSQTTEAPVTTEVQPTSSEAKSQKHELKVVDGITYVDGIMIVNKSYSLPESYDPGLDSEATAAFERMQQAATEDGIELFILSGYRSYTDQEYQYNVHVQNKGKAVADEVSARPGFSEHQSGLCMDINSTEDSFAGTPEAEWLDKHCAEYGFIIRFPKGKESITGYNYEPWHIRYVGKETAKEITDAGLCLEEYLGVDSKYKD